MASNVAAVSIPMAEHIDRDGGPAFPTQPHLIPRPDGQGFLNLREYGAEGQPGMSIRQWYASLVLQSLLALWDKPITWVLNADEKELALQAPFRLRIGREAFAWADSLIEAEKGTCFEVPEKQLRQMQRTIGLLCAGITRLSRGLDAEPASPDECLVILVNREQILKKELARMVDLTKRAEGYFIKNLPGVFDELFAEANRLGDAIDADKPEMFM